MKFPGINRKHLKICTILGFLFLFSITVALASGGGESVHQGWSATDTYRIMCFVVLVGILFFLLRKPVPHALNSRIKGIRDQLKELEAKKNEVENELSQCNQKLSRLNEEAEKVVEDYIKQGKEAKDRIIKEAEATAEKIEIQARRSIENEFEKAKAGLQAEIINKALAKAEQVIKTKISAEDQDRLVYEYLDKVVA